MTNEFGCRRIFGEGSVLTAIAQHLLGIAFGVGGTYIDNATFVIVDQLQARIDEALVWCDIKPSIAT